MSVEELIIKLRSEKDYKSLEKRLFNSKVAKANINIIKHGESSKNNNNKTKVSKTGSNWDQKM